MNPALHQGTQSPSVCSGGHRESSRCGCGQNSLCEICTEKERNEISPFPCLISKTCSFRKIAAPSVTHFSPFIHRRSCLFLFFFFFSHSSYSCSFSPPPFGRPRPYLLPLRTWPYQRRSRPAFPASALVRHDSTHNGRNFRREANQGVSSYA